ncbi:hypothetical protein MANES_17G052400v8 [Manihot esculenta]|uniref:Uncharacterized protein n=1 Tax=Manihot esculenta TaxID=3983 RepID=A0ACC8C9Y5_MANES|nr:hypothetical protein MANES_17G052400v8 [Manihot esculenta]
MSFIFLFVCNLLAQSTDCCDGSDEYDGQVKCQNTCWEAGKAARDKLRKKIATYKEGVALRRQVVEQAKQAIAKDEAELSKLKSGERILKGIVQQLKEHKEQIEKAEEKERLQKEKEEREKIEAEGKSNSEKSRVEEDTQQEKGEAKEKTDVGNNQAESVSDDKIGAPDDSHLDQDETGEQADHAAVAEIADSSKIEGSSVNEVKQHVAQVEDKSISPESKYDSAVVSETGHASGREGSHDQTAKVGNDASENTEGLSKEELGRLVASRWTGASESQTEGFEKSERQIEGVDVAKDNDHKDMPADMRDEEYDEYASEIDDETGKYGDVDTGDDIDETYEEDAHDGAGSSYKPDPEDELDLSDITTPSNPSWMEKIQQTLRRILRGFNFFQPPVNKSEAARIRKEYEESSTKLSKLQSRISSLTEKLKHDFGTGKEFYSLYDHCFESKQNKYVYKICPFKQASQEEGYATTRLGSWDKFEDSYRFMIFSNGDRCWNGPDRSLKVKLHCGLKNELTDVDEPSRCEYVALLSTPALCLEEKVKKWEDKLDLMDKNQPQGRDEL